jgi:hypothetical protein
MAKVFIIWIVFSLVAFLYQIYTKRNWKIAIQQSTIQGFVLSIFVMLP